MRALKGEKIIQVKRTPKRIELKDLFRLREFSGIESALITSRLGFHSPYPPRRVNSLYFDSHDFRALEHSISGSSIRKKTRLRWYGETEDAHHPTLELKCKQGHLSWKTLQKTELHIDPKAPDWASAFLNETEDSARPNLRNLLPVNQHRPTTFVSYCRRYYESADGRIRVTMDNNLAFRDQTSGIGPNFTHLRQHPEKLVLEIKLAEKNIDTLEELARTLPFVPRRFSKYCESLLGHLPRWR